MKKSQKNQKKKIKIENNNKRRRIENQHGYEKIKRNLILRISNIKIGWKREKNLIKIYKYFLGVFKRDIKVIVWILYSLHNNWNYNFSSHL